LAVITKKGITHVPDMKEYLLHNLHAKFFFSSNLPLQPVFTATSEPMTKNQNTHRKKAIMQVHVVPGLNLSVGKSVMGFKERIPLVSYNEKKLRKW
jgi:hypothetical protein